MNDFINKVKEEYQNKIKTPINNTYKNVKKEINENLKIQEFKEKIKDFLNKKWN